MTTSPPVLPSTARASLTPASTILRAATQHPAASVAAGIVAVTLLGAITSMLVPELGPARAPRPTLRGTPGEAFAIAVTNARTLLAPLLLAAGRWHTSRVTRCLGDIVVAAIVIANAALIGLALGRHPIALLAYLPHLPLEDAALATAAAAWLTRRVGERAPRAGCRPTVPEQHPRKAHPMKPATNARRTAKPTPKQLRYLRQLAERTGTTFTPPHSLDAASDEIKRLLKLTQSSRADLTREKRAVQRDLAERPDDATQVRPDDVVGYGSSARWAHRPDDEQRS